MNDQAFKVGYISSDGDMLTRFMDAFCEPDCEDEDEEL